MYRSLLQGFHATRRYFETLILLCVFTCGVAGCVCPPAQRLLAGESSPSLRDMAFPPTIYTQAELQRLRHAALLAEADELKEQVILVRAWVLPEREGQPANRGGIQILAVEPPERIAGLRLFLKPERGTAFRFLDVPASVPAKYVPEGSRPFFIICVLHLNDPEGWRAPVPDEKADQTRFATVKAPGDFEEAPNRSWACNCLRRMVVKRGTWMCA